MTFRGLRLLQHLPKPCFATQQRTFSSTSRKMTIPQLQGLQIEVQQEGQGTRETRRGKYFQLLPRCPARTPDPIYRLALSPCALSMQSSKQAPKV